MDQILTDIWNNDIYRLVIQTALILVGSFVLRRIFRWSVLSRLPDDSPHIYGVRRVASFSLNLLAAFLIFGL